MSKKQSDKAFPGQHDGEEVQLVFRQHPLVMRKQLIVGLLVILVAILPADFLPQFFDIEMKIFGYVCLAVFLWWVYRFVGWYYTVYIVTTERLIEVKQKGLFDRTVTEFGIDKIQNINYHIDGFQAVLFQYGDITARTYVGDLVMEKIYRPVKIHQQMVSIVRRFNSTQPQN